MLPGIPGAGTVKAAAKSVGAMADIAKGGKKAENAVDVARQAENVTDAVRATENASKGASETLPQLKGKPVPQIEKTLNQEGFIQTKVSNSPAKNQTWSNVDGSEVRIHPYGNLRETPYKSANNAHVHKQSQTGTQLTDRGIPSTDPTKTHIGIKNPKDLPDVRDRPHGAGTQ